MLRTNHQKRVRQAARIRRMKNVLIRQKVRKEDITLSLIQIAIEAQTVSRVTYQQNLPRRTSVEVFSKFFLMD